MVLYSPEGITLACHIKLRVISGRVRDDGEIRGEKSFGFSESAMIAIGIVLYDKNMASNAVSVRFSVKKIDSNLKWVFPLLSIHLARYALD